MIVSELADRTGVSTRSLRYYDAHGLLQAERRGNRYRDFPEDAIEQVARIQSLLGLGLTLEEVKKLMPCFGENGTLRACDTARRKLTQQIDAIDSRIATLQQTRAMLDDAVTRLAVGPSGNVQVAGPATRSLEDGANKRRVPRSDS